MNAYNIWCSHKSLLEFSLADKGAPQNVHKYTNTGKQMFNKFAPNYFQTIQKI